MKRNRSCSAAATSHRIVNPGGTGTFRHCPGVLLSVHDELKQDRYTLRPRFLVLP